MPAVHVGANPRGEQPPLIAKVSDGVAVWPPAEVSTEVVVYVPQVLGLASGAFGPPLNSRWKLLNGNGGLSSNVVVNCPVTGSGDTVPASLTTTP